MMKKWEPQRNEIHDWKKNKVLKGVYTQSRIVLTPNGESAIYTIDVGGGKMVDVWGKKMLDDFFKNMKIGTTIEIKYLGKKKSQKGGRTYYDFEFYYDDSAVPDVVEQTKEIFDVPEP